MTATTTSDTLDTSINKGGLRGNTNMMIGSSCGLQISNVLGTLHVRGTLRLVGVLATTIARMIRGLKDIDHCYETGL